MSKRMSSRWYLVLAIVALTSTVSLALSYDISASDAIEEYVSDGGMSMGSGDLEMPYEDVGNSPGSEQVIGVRWVVPVAPGAEILSAYVEFAVDENKGGTDPVNLIIEGQLTPNAPAFEDVARNVSSRSPWTTAQVQWTVENWTTVGTKSRTTDIAPIIQEIIDQPGWLAGNALVLAFRDDKNSPSTGVRCAETQPVLLHLEVFNPAAYAPEPANGEIGVAMPLVSWTKGDGAVFHNVYLGTTPELTEANLVAAKAVFPMHYHTPGLVPGGVYYWRVDEVGIDGQVITGPVWSFVMQAETAYYPTPADGSMDASPSVVLTWQAGVAAMEHHVYFGNDQDSVSQGAAGTDKGETSDTTFTPSALEAVTTYYWRVDEIGLGGAVKSGPVWSFTTNLPVDDFESYTHDEGSRIYEAWVDGWTNNTGSLVGNLTAPFAEHSIVHGGAQSMPMDFNNADPPFYSEAEYVFATQQDWPSHGVDTLSLWIRGQSSNAATSLYAALEDSAGQVAVISHPTVVNAPVWTPWSIPLSDFAGVNPARIKKMYIGVGDRGNPTAGGAGRIYIDDIRLIKPQAVSTP